MAYNEHSFMILQFIEMFSIKKLIIILSLMKGKLENDIKVGVTNQNH